MANENSIDVYHALMALEEKVTGVAPDPENVTTDVALALADIFRTDAPMAQETAIVNAIDTITANYGGGGGVDFTTASVVFVNNATVDDYTVPCPNVYEGDLFCDIDSGDMDGETSFDVVLYGGKLDVRLPMDVEIKVASVSGSIEIDGSSICITGDGTVTYEDA